MNPLPLEKPRIRIRFGIWCCVTKAPFVCGCGYTVADAYLDWKRIFGEAR